MNDVRRFTTDYIAVEDRIRMSVEHRDRSVQILWLTRPLLKNLLVALIKAIDAAPSVGNDVDDVSMKGTAYKRFTQQAAEASLTSQSPVRAPSSDTQAVVAMLVTSITVRKEQTVLTMEFNGGDRLLEAIPFSTEALRQWLAVLYKCYRRADWEGDFWPTWIKAPSPLVGAARLN
ncbi:hypothetical protein JQX09_24460 [Sulfitobacter pseudonitzschiae]|uniref:Uncharacterized protein n=1 Tax=Pseudosulfitobacter pseudonitzschiae TaxID=1402135 RepID=A0A9Q2P763_9RHOB|nr:hypothetical protein [Pseudosulfitobacter pseudonitzschiae]MBM2295076.1 hypothetical protein [Pseudosulfitobacter pseudonitzschiae]MBM2299998.1 hypothetical protein [Pseudosulfitobacter pseudonitzschiae]MBM2304914.1 hypothetical protein [Pseudosulfitobacter pseudonitzschiae]MBM2314687.1 hypothetical protein [Pseudosulfitobacter pseudonitzschiae]MBM2319595.1 hypothetical protein [Pseudosulfitobacter pseudonitzschiae]